MPFLWSLPLIQRVQSLEVQSSYILVSSWFLMSFLGLKVSVLLSINSKGIAWLLPNIYFNKSCEYKDAIGPIYELGMMMAMGIRMMTGKDLYCV